MAISNHPDVMLKMMLEPGDFQFINNRTILHGRAHFEDREAKDQRRHLYRLWINVPEWPRMPASQSTLVAADMARWDALAAQHRAATPAWAS
jgi:redox-sensitive bicupin YhaK (pirin superfamily)